MTLNERAQKARKALFNRYDQLNALWERAEEELTRLHIPHPIEFVYRHYEDDWRDPSGAQIAQCLGIQKIKGKWRICHGTYVMPHEPGPDDWTPITDCSGDVRIEAARHLLALKQAIVEAAERFIPRADAAIAALAESLGLPPEMSSLAELIAERARLNGHA